MAFRTVSSLCNSKADGPSFSVAPAVPCARLGCTDRQATGRPPGKPTSLGRPICDDQLRGRKKRCVIDFNSHDDLTALCSRYFQDDYFYLYTNAKQNASACRICSCPNHSSLPVLHASCRRGTGNGHLSCTTGTGAPRLRARSRAFSFVPSIHP